MKKNKIASHCGFLVHGIIKVIPILFILTSCQSESSLEQILPVVTSEQRLVMTPAMPNFDPTRLAEIEEQHVMPEVEPVSVAHDLFLPAPGKIYHGVWLPVGDVLNPDDIAAFEEEVNVPLDSVLYYVPWFEEDWMWCERQLSIAAQAGLFLQIVWEPWLPEKDNPLQAIVDGEMDEHIHRFARGAAAYGGVFFLRFAHEMNGNWYPWSGEKLAGGTSLYVDAWRHVWQIFDDAGAKNVVWVWAPNYVSVPAESWNDIQQYYPGVSYVDWVGVDFFGLKWTDEYPENMLDGIYSLYANSHPIMIAETAASDPFNAAPAASISKPMWIEKLFDILPLYPQVQAVYWFNDVKEADWRVQSEPHPESLNAYSEGWQRLKSR